MQVILKLLGELLAIVLASPNPEAALKRAKVAAETETLNAAADEALKEMP